MDSEFAARAQYDTNSEQQKANTTIASISTRQIQYVEDQYKTFPTVPITEEYRIDTKPFINRPFFFSSIDWNKTSPIYTALPLNAYRLPRDVLLSNPSLNNAIKLGAYFRSELELGISVAGTITHAGCLLVGILPPLPLDLSFTDNYFPLINTILTGPHAFLHANEATSVMLPVPWYCNSDLATLDIDPVSGIATSVDLTINNGNYATLILLVLNPLAPSEGSSETLNVVIEAFFRSLDILVPSPKFLTLVRDPPTSQGLFDLASNILNTGISVGTKTISDGIDSMRNSLRKYTGLHNTNVPYLNTKNIVVNRNYTNLVDKPQYFEKLDPFGAQERIISGPDFNNLEDEMTIKNIITKKQFIGTFKVKTNMGVGALVWTRPISPFQGGLKSSTLEISNNIEAMHFLSRGFSGDLEVTLQSVMNNKQQVKLRLLQLYNPSGSLADNFPTYRSILNAPSHLMEFTAGGQYQSVTLPYLCRNNITPCMRDMNAEALFHGLYYIYVAQPIANSAGSPEEIYFNVFISCKDNFKFYGYATELATVKPVFKSESLDVMNEPQKQGVVLSTINSSPTLDSQRLDVPTDVRPYIRRMYKSSAGRFTKFQSFSLSDLIGESGFNQLTTPSFIISSMFYGKHAGLKIKIKVINAKTPTIKFVPPNYFIDKTTLTVKACPVNINNKWYDDDTSASYPFPLQEISTTQESANTFLFEFIIPNISFYKYIGSPDKLFGTNNGLSTRDLGDIVIYDSFNDEAMTYIVYTGLSDESRLGFHTIAPYIVPYQLEGKLQTVYSGNFETGPDNQPLITRNNYFYFTST